MRRHSRTHTCQAYSVINNSSMSVRSCTHLCAPATAASTRAHRLFVKVNTAPTRTSRRRGSCVCDYFETVNQFVAHASLEVVESSRVDRRVLFLASSPLLSTSSTLDNYNGHVHSLRAAENRSPHFVHEYLQVVYTRKLRRRTRRAQLHASHHIAGPVASIYLSLSLPPTLVYS